MRAKALVWSSDEYGGADAASAIGRFAVFIGRDDVTWCAQHYLTARHVVVIGFELPTEAEAKAACQAEFERIWREMTDMEGST